MLPGDPWYERLIFLTFHLHSSWLFLPVCSALMLMTLVYLRRSGRIQLGYFHIVIIALGLLPIVVFTLKDVRVWLDNATLGYVWGLKSAYLVIGLPTLVLLIASLALLTLDWLATSKTRNQTPKVIAASALLGLLQIAQSMWLYEVGAPL